MDSLLSYAGRAGNISRKAHESSPPSAEAAAGIPRLHGMCRQWTTRLNLCGIGAALVGRAQRACRWMLKRKIFLKNAPSGTSMRLRYRRALKSIQNPARGGVCFVCIEESFDRFADRPGLPEPAELPAVRGAPHASPGGGAGRAFRKDGKRRCPHGGNVENELYRARTVKMPLLNRAAPPRRPDTDFLLRVSVV